MARIAVVGGGMGGLATALFAARRGHEAVVVDRDPGPPDGDVDALAAWDRRGVVQAGFSHYFLARSTRIVREEAPDLLDTLARVGITPSNVRFGEGYEDDRALTARRPVYEAALRQFVEEQAGVDLLHASVREFVTGGAEPSRVVGIRTDDGHQVDADLVVDAGGRRSASGRWLSSVGIERPGVYEEPVDRHYYCRHYRLRDGERYPADDVPIVQPLPYGMVLVFIGDNDTFSVAFELSKEDPVRERLQEPEVFDRFLRGLPMTAPWMDRSEPISDLHVMAGLSNRRRRLVVDGQPLASGLALVGDSLQYTNPALGQGVSLTFWMAQTLAGMVEQFTEDPRKAVVEYESWVDEELGPRFERQLVVDREANRQVQAGLRGEGFIAPAEDDSRFVGAVLRLASEDEELLARARRVAHLLERPSAIREDPELLKRVAEILEEGPPVMTGEGPLPRGEFEELVAG